MLAAMNKKKYIIISSAAVGVVILLVAVWLLTGGALRKSLNSLQKALNPSQYDTMQVAVSIETKAIETSDQNGESDDYEDYEQLDTEQPLPSQDVPDEGPVDVITMQKSGGIIYEKGINGESYFFRQDDVDYVIFCDVMTGNIDKGVWTKIRAGQYNLKPTFTAANLTGLSTDDFVLRDGVYVPKPERLEHVFFTLLDISAVMQDQYFVLDMEVAVKNNRIDKITVSYELLSTHRMKQIMSFSYDEIALELPHVEVDYSG